MDKIANGFEREVGKLIRFNTNVTRIDQSDKGVTISYVDVKTPGETLQAMADWCVCTIPLSKLSQI